MFKNAYQQTINAPVQSVWFALTHSQEIESYMKNIKVISDWHQGASIEYTCYEQNGSIMEWEGMAMIWKGVIEVLDENKEFTCLYPDTETGLVKERYLLQVIDANTTNLIFEQYTITAEMGQKYKDGTQETLKLLKSFLEK